MVVPIGQVRAGKLRALAVTTATRSEALPDIPTVGEFVPGYEASVWFGLGAPKGTPAEIIDKLNLETNAALADPKIKARIASQVAMRSRARLPTSQSSSPTKPRNGPRWSRQPTSRPNKSTPVAPTFHNFPFRQRLVSVCVGDLIE